MYKKVLASLTAVSMAVMMLTVPSVTAYATEPTEIVPDNNDAGRSAVNINPNGGDPSNVVVNDNISVSGGDSSQSAVIATDGATVTINPSTDEQPAVSSTAVGVDAEENASVKVNGNVVAGIIGVNSSNNASVVVEGNVTATSGTVSTTEGTTITGTGITSHDQGSVYVSGNVSALNNGVAIYVDPTSGSTSKGNIVVRGAISSADGNGIFIYDTLSAAQTDADTWKNQIPDITVYDIQTEGCEPVAVTFNALSGLTQEEQNNVRNEILESINYIIHYDSSLGLEFVSGTTQKSDAIQDSVNYVTTNKGREFVVRAANLASTHTLDVGTNIRMVEDGEGNYILTLLDNKGGINIRAKLRPVTVVNNEDTSSSAGEAKPEVVYEVEIQETTPSTPAPEQTVSGEVVTTTPLPAAAPEIAAISGDKPARTVSYDLTKVTPVQYRDSVVKNIASAPASGAFNITTDRVSFFDRNMIEAIAARPDLDVNVVFSYAGKTYKVTIPAGYDVRTLLDFNGFCGYLRLLDILGGTTL